MPENKVLIREKMLAWEGMLNDFALPGWDELPTLPLYMDQVIYLMNQYLTLLPKEEEDKLVTPAMINNYVKLKIIPPPEKKRYGRAHLAFLIMVCVLKQSINTGEIRKIVPLTMTEEETEALYGSFVAVFHQGKEEFRARVRQAAQPIFAQDGPSVTKLVFQAAAAANLAQLLAVQVLGLYPEPEKAAGSK